MATCPALSNVQRDARQGPPPVSSPAETGVPASISLQPSSSSSRDAARPDPPLSLDATLLDAMAVDLTASLAQVVVPLAQAAKRFAKTREWRNFGYRRVHDFARERLKRSGRWLQQLAQLGRGLDRFPALGSAVSGSDGGAPLGKVAALEVLRVAKPATLDAWIGRARSMTVRELQQSIAESLDDSPDPRVTTREERWARSYDRTPPGLPENMGFELPQRSRVGLFVPSAVRVTFDECLDLHRALVGAHVPASAFVEALVAEAASGDPAAAAAAADRRVPLRLPRSRSNREDWFHSVGAVREHLVLDPASTEVVRGSLEVLERLHQLRSESAPLSADDLCARLRALIEIEDDIEQRLAGVLLQMDGIECWESMGFLDAGHYGRVRLGISRTTVEERLRVARSLRRFPILREAYRSRAIGVEAASVLRRILGRSAADRDIERDWVRHASRITVKRLRDESRAITRERVALGGNTTGRTTRNTIGRDDARPPRPLDAAAWHASLELRPGTILRRTAEFGLAANRHPFADSWLWMRLDDSLADAFLSTVEARRRALLALGLELTVSTAFKDKPERPVYLRQEGQLVEVALTPATMVARAFALRCEELPPWVGLLSLLEEYVATWDSPKGVPKRKSDAVYSRDGWRCLAPGCTERAELEDHHFRYRSRGGSNALSNRGCLCAFHHRLGEHGNLLSCSGTAPLDVTWRLGREDLAEWFRNETRIPPPETMASVEHRPETIGAAI